MILSKKRGRSWPLEFNFIIIFVVYLLGKAHINHVSKYIGYQFSNYVIISLRGWAAVQVLNILNLFQNQALFWIFPKLLHFFIRDAPNYYICCLHSQQLTELWYNMPPNMVYKRIIGSHQIGNYLAGHVPPIRKSFGGTVPPNSLPLVLSLATILGKF